MNYQIVNARIVNEGTITECIVVIEGERIKGINVPAPENCETIDAKGAYLLSLQGLDAFVLIPLNLLLRHYFLHLIDFLC